MSDNELERVSQAVDYAQAQAIAYAWGRQDERKVGAEYSENDTLMSSQFGQAYAARKRAFLTEQSFFLPNIRDAYEEWMTTGTIK